MTSPVSAPAPQQQIMSIVQGYWQSRALGLVTQLGIADHLAEGPVDLNVLAERTGTHGPSLYRVLRALESIGVFTEVSPHKFANTAVSECLRKDAPGSQYPIVRLTLTGSQCEAWTGLHKCVTTGKTAFDEVYGCTLWEFYERDREWSDIFNQSMRSLSFVMTPAVTAALDWSQFPVIADIGGGIGTQIVDILRTFPSCRGILFDRPQVVSAAIPHDRLRTTAGSFFETVPQGADVYMLRGVIHDWAEPEAISILRTVRSAMKRTSKLALVENVLPESKEFSFGKWIDLQMLVVAGGRERTAREYGQLLRETGFEVEQVIPTASSLSIILATMQ